MPHRVLTLSSIGVLAVLLGASCGSVATRPGDGGTGTGGATASDAGTGGGLGTDGGVGGAAGTGGRGAGGSSGSDAGLPADAGIQIRRGGVTPLGPSSGSGSIRVRRQRLGAAQVCAGNICASGGLVVP